VEITVTLCCYYHLILLYFLASSSILFNISGCGLIIAHLTSSIYHCDKVEVACIILTKNVDTAAQNVVPVLDDIRKEFTWQYYKATGFRGKIDTTISPELRTYVLG
jgi:hypothetical protein